MVRGKFKPRKAKKGEKGFTITFTRKGRRPKPKSLFTERGAKNVLKKLLKAKKKGELKEFKNLRLKRVF